jgi:transposase
VFANLAARGKSSMGWFYGFKLHLIVNDQGELLTFLLTPGNVDDRAPVPDMTRDLFGLLVGDKGYISQNLFAELYEQGLKLVTPIRKNMKNRLMHLEEKLLLRKRAIIETVNDQLKNISQIEHTRHRSPTNFLVNLVCGLIAYCHQTKKPAITLPPEDMALLNECHEGAMILV